MATRKDNAFQGLLCRKTSSSSSSPTHTIPPPPLSDCLSVSPTLNHLLPSALCLSTTWSALSLSTHPLHLLIPSSHTPSTRKTFITSYLFYPSLSLSLTRSAQSIFLPLSTHYPNLSLSFSISLPDGLYLKKVSVVQLHTTRVLLWKLSFFFNFFFNSKLMPLIDLLFMWYTLSANCFVSFSEF